MTDTTTSRFESVTSTEPSDDASSCFNKTTNSGFTANFVIFKKSVNIYFVGLAIVFGLVGNALSVVVLRRDRQADAKQRSSTNHLLRMLAIVDSLYLVTCVFIQTLKTIIENTEWFPGSPLRYHYLHSEPLVWMLSSAAQTSTVWLVLLVTLDRYLAVCKPWKSSWRTPRFVATAVATLALLALLYNLPRFFERVVITRRLCTNRMAIIHKSFNGSSLQTLLIENFKSNSSAITLLDTVKQQIKMMDSFNHSTKQTSLVRFGANGSSESLQFVTRTLRTEFRNNKIYFLVYKTVMYFLFRSFGPLIMMIFCNFRLVSDLRKVRKRRRDMLSRRVQHKENITVMLVVVVTVFIICQIPALAVRVAVTVMEFNQNIHLNLQILRYINELSNALLTVNSSINFIIYCLVGKKFQKSFMSIVSCTSRTNDVGASDEGSKSIALNRSTTLVTKCLQQHQQQQHQQQQQRQEQHRQQLFKESKQADKKLAESSTFNGSVACATTEPRLSSQATQDADVLDKNG